MADTRKHGEDWTDGELDAIVADYFDMLAAEVAGSEYVKRQHRMALMATIGRGGGSIEFKHQNISAVLDELGLPWIRGYIPMRNYQNSIFVAIDRYLTSHPAILEFTNPVPVAPLDITDVFVPLPDLKSVAPLPVPLQRLVRKFDPVVRDFRNRTLGRAGEEFVVKLEQRRLIAEDRSDLARRVRWVSMEDGDGAGYDVQSFDVNGCERLLEVKTTNGSARTPFFLTRTEREMSSERPQDWLIYRVHLFAEQPRVFTVSPPLESVLTLRAETWRAAFNADPSPSVG